MTNKFSKVESIIKPNLNQQYQSGIYDLDDVQKHNKPGDAWVIYNQKVYDISEYYLKHPGGADLLLKLAG